MRALGIGLTVRGRERGRNEDAHFVDDEMGLYVVSDGIGGRSGGDLASKTTVQTIAEHFEKNKDVLEDAVFKMAPVKDVAQLAEQAIGAACRAVFDLAESQPEVRSMGATVTVLVILDDKAVMAHVGNTRLYLLRDGEAHKLSTDHTMAAELCAAGVISEQEVREHPYSSILTRAVGKDSSVLVDTLVIDVTPDDRFLLCTNGLARHLDAGESLAELLEGELGRVPDALMDYAQSQGAEDDITVIVAQPTQGNERITLTEPLVTVAGCFDVLKRVPLFHDLSFEHLQRVLNLGEVRRFEEGDVVIGQGEPCPGLFVMLTEGFALEQGQKRIAQLGTGDYLGETGLLQDRPCRSTLVAADRGRLLSIDKVRFSQLTHMFPRLGIDLLERLVEITTIDADRIRVSLQTGRHERLSPSDIF